MESKLPAPGTAGSSGSELTGWLGAAAWPACIREPTQSPRGASAKAVAMKSPGRKSKAGEQDSWWENTLGYKRALFSNILTWFNPVVLVHEPYKKSGTVLHEVLDSDSCPRNTDHVSRHISITVCRFLCRQSKVRDPKPAQVVKQIPNSLPMPTQGLSSGFTTVRTWGTFQIPSSANGRRETDKGSKSALGCPDLYLTIDYRRSEKKCLD